jgi:hypothetical protein
MMDESTATCTPMGTDPIISGLPTPGTLVLFVISCLLLAWAFCLKILSTSGKRHVVSQNGISGLFAIRLVLMGPGFQTLMKLTAETSRRRLFTGMRRFVFFGREIWMAGHPALCKHIFTPAHHRLFRKIDKEELANLMFQGGGDPNYASKSVPCF